MRLHRGSSLAAFVSFTCRAAMATLVVAHQPSEASTEMLAVVAAQLSPLRNATMEGPAAAAPPLHLNHSAPAAVAPSVHLNHSADVEHTEDEIDLLGVEVHFGAYGADGESTSRTVRGRRWWEPAYYPGYQAPIREWQYHVAVISIAAVPLIAVALYLRARPDDCHHCFGHTHTSEHPYNTLLPYAKGV
jgi:hypothetical protein